MKRGDSFLYTMNSSQHSGFLAFQRRRHHKRKSSHFKSAQVLQCSCQGSFLTGSYLQRSVPVGHDPLEAALPTLTCTSPSTEKAEEGCWMFAGIQQLPQLTLCPSCCTPATGQHCSRRISFYFESPQTTAQKFRKTGSDAELPHQTE